MILAVAALFFQIAPLAPAATVDAGTQAAATSASTANSTAQPALVAANDTPMSVGIATNPAPVTLAPKSTTAPLSIEAMNSAAQTSLSTIRVPELPLEKPVHFDAESLPSRKKWLALAVVEHGAAAFDAYETRNAISHGAHEDDPFLRPVANSDGIYALIQVAPVMLDYASYKMQRMNNNLLRHSWWLPQSLGAAIYFVSGVHDLHVANQR